MLIVPLWTWLAGLVEWLFGCSHRRTTFPITARGDDSTRGLEAPPKETYVVCLECGRQFAYDWTTMRLDSGGRPAPNIPKGRG